jgi:hypothetical protein
MGLALMYIPMYSASKTLAKCCDDLQNIKFAVCCKKAVPRCVVVVWRVRFTSMQERCMKTAS